MPTHYFRRLELRPWQSNAPTTRVKKCSKNERFSSLDKFRCEVAHDSSWIKRFGSPVHVIYERRSWAWVVLFYWLSPSTSTNRARKWTISTDLETSWDVVTKRSSNECLLSLYPFQALRPCLHTYKSPFHRPESFVWLYWPRHTTSNVVSRGAGCEKSRIYLECSNLL